MKTLWLIPFLAAAAVAACDPVHSSQVDAIPPDPSGQRNGPLHRAGQRCGLCHDGALGNPPGFSVAGTIYVDDQATQAASGATVNLTDATGATYATSTNEVGNFYIRPQEFTPQYPMTVSVNYQGTDVKMSSVIGRGGSCAQCHYLPAGPTSAGPVYIPTDGGTP